MVIIKKILSLDCGNCYCQIYGEAIERHSDSKYCDLYYKSDELEKLLFIREKKKSTITESSH